VSVARGMAVVGGSQAILVAGFLCGLGLWAAFFAYATLLAAVPPALMVHFDSLPPLRSLLVDVLLLGSGRTAPVAGALGLSVLVVLYRAALTGVWLSLILEGLQPSGGTEAGRGSGLGAALRRALRAYPSLVGIEAGFLTLALASWLVAATFLGPAFGQVAVMAALIGGMYFFVYAPVVAVVEGARPRSAIRLAIRAARVPGPTHLMFTVGYVALALLISQVAPSGRLARATPSISVWAYVAFVSFLHLSAQAVLVYRWLAVGPHLLDRGP